MSSKNFILIVATSVMVGPWVADVPVGPTDGSAILGMVGGSINSSLKFKLSPEKVDDALGSSVLLCRNGDDGAEMIICGLTFKK